MSLEKRVMDDMKAAMKAKDKVALRSIRSLKAEILKFKTSGTGEELTAELEIKMVQKMVKQRQESYDVYVEQGRDDLATPEKEEMEILAKYLPEQLDESALKDVISKVIAEVGASSMRDMGKVMGIVSKQLAGKADGKMISTMVKLLLS